MYMYIPISISISIYVYTSLSSYIYVYIYTQIYYIYLSVYLSIHPSIHLYVYLSIYICIPYRRLQYHVLCVQSGFDLPRIYGLASLATLPRIVSEADLNSTRGFKKVRGSTPSPLFVASWYTLYSRQMVAATYHTAKDSFSSKDFYTNCVT